MAKYVDGYVIVVPKKNIPQYKKDARAAGKTWMKHGALEYKECVGDDLNISWIKLTFPKLTKIKKNETVVFSYVLYKSKKHRDSVNKKVMKEMLEYEKKHGKMKMPFDMNKMAFGGFKTLVDL